MQNWESATERGRKERERFECPEAHGTNTAKATETVTVALASFKSTSSLTPHNWNKIPKLCLIPRMLKPKRNKKDTAGKLDLYNLAGTTDAHVELIF